MILLTLRFVLPILMRKLGNEEGFETDMLRQDDSKRTASERFLEAIEAQRNQFPLRELAEKFGVSTTTLTQIEKNKFGQISGKRKANTKQLQGWAESITRICLYLETDVSGKPLQASDVVQSYGIPLSGPVQRAINRIVTSFHGARGPLDPVLEAIAARGGRVRVGVLRWEPFVIDGEDIEQSWAWKFTEKLIACINPDWKCDPVELRAIDEALSAVRRGHDPCDVVFGIYDTPYRRWRGLDFVHLPGIGVPLGVLYSSEAKASIDWEYLIFPERGGSLSYPNVVVMKDEAGHLFLRGACRYPDSHFRFIGTDASDTAAIAAGFARNVDYDRNSIFVADAVTVARVHREIRAGSEWLKIIEKDVDDEARIRRACATVQNLELDENASNFVPYYRLGLSVRAEAERWRNLMLRARDDELFTNAIRIAAQDYATILSRSGQLSVIPAVFTAPTCRLEALARTVRDLLNSSRESKTEQYVKTHIEQIEKQWLKEVSNGTRSNPKTI